MTLRRGVSTDARMLRAITLRIVVSGELSSTPQETLPVAAAGCAARAQPVLRVRSGRREAAAGSRHRRCMARVRTSCQRRRGSPPRRVFVTRPPRPVPGIFPMSSECSATMRATTGDMKLRASPSPFPFVSPSSTGAGAAAAGAALGRRGSGGFRRRCRRGCGRPGAGARPPASPDEITRDARADVDRLALGHEDLGHDRAGSRATAPPCRPCRSRSRRSSRRRRRARRPASPSG